MLGELRWSRITEGLCCQMMHIGSYDSEPATFAQMDRLAEESGCSRTGYTHHEIYLSDFRKVPAEKLRTILRYQIVRN